MVVLITGLINSGSPTDLVLRLNLLTLSAASGVRVAYHDPLASCLDECRKVSSYWGSYGIPCKTKTYER